MQGVLGIFHTTGGGVEGLTGASGSVRQLSDMGWIVDPALFFDELSNKVFFRTSGFLLPTAGAESGIRFHLYSGGSWTQGNQIITDGDLVASSSTFFPDSDNPFVWTTDFVDIGSDLIRFRIAYENLGANNYQIGFYHTALFAEVPIPPPEDQCGLPFKVDSVEVINNQKLRVRFTDEIDDADVTPGNFTLTNTSGNDAPEINIVTKNSEDSEVVDLILLSPLHSGSYQLEIDSTVVSVDTTPLLAPYVAAFLYTPVAQAPISLGAQNNTMYQRLRKLWNPAYLGRDNWEALIEGIAAADQLIADQAMAAFNQLYVSSASGRYLEKRAGDRGIKKPVNTGLTDTIFRKLVTTVSNSKLTTLSFLEVLEQFYGVEATHAFVETGTAQPFVISDNSTLDVLVDEKVPVRVQFHRDQFQTMRRATADEVAAVITRACELNRNGAYAVPYEDRETGDIKVRIYSPSRGLASSMRITGGSAQPALLFETPSFTKPEPEPLNYGIWTITIPVQGVVRWTYDSEDFYDFSNIEVGDYVVIRGVEFAAANRGNGSITAVNYEVGSMWFEVANPGAEEQDSITQCKYEDLEFFRPRRKTTYDAPSYAHVVQRRGDSFVSIAATTIAIERISPYAAYMQGAAGIECIAVERFPSGLTTVTTLEPHGLSIGAWIDIDDCLVNTPDSPAATDGSPSAGFDGNNLAAGVSDAAKLTHFTQDTTFEGVYAQGLTGVDNEFWAIGGVLQSTSAVTGEQHRIEFLTLDDEPTLDDSEQRSVAYTWHRGTDVDIRAIGASHAVIEAAAYHKHVLATGGYTTHPWDVFADDFYVTDAKRYVRVPAPTNIDVATTSVGPDVASVANCGLTATVSANAVFKFGGETILNQAISQWEFYNPPGDTFFPGGSMRMPRSMPMGTGLVKDIDATVMVMGGRIPFADHRDTYSFSTWHFEDAEASSFFVGPIVDVAVNGNTRPPGKSGHGADLANDSTAAPGVDAAIMSGTLLQDTWTIVGWMTRASGSVISNLNQPWASEDDNTLVHFGIDPADDLFFIRWQYGVGPTTQIRKSTITATEAMPVEANSAYPRYYHFAITKSTEEGSSTFKVYINGVLLIDQTDTAPSGGGNGLWSFGRAVTGSIGAYNGQVDEVGFTIELLTPAQIKKMYLDEVGVAYDSPIDLDAQPVGRVLASCEILGAEGPGVYTGAMAYARFAAGVITLPDNRVLVAGGIGYHATQDPIPDMLSQRQCELKSAEIYDPTTGSWSPITDMNWSHSHCGVTLVGDEKVYIYGGLTNKHVEYLDLRTMTWHVVVESLREIGVHAATGRVGSDCMVVAGGELSSTSTASVARDWVGVTAGENVRAGGIDGRHQIISIGESEGDSITLVFQTPEQPVWTVGSSSFTATPVAAPEGTWQGPFIYDTKGGDGYSGVDTTNVTRLEIGQNYQLLTLASGGGDDIPDTEGYLVFQLGYSNQVGPVKYLRNLGSDVLMLDASFKFPATIEPGSNVTLLHQRGAFVPDHPETAGSVYITASPSGRIAAEQMVTDISAAGIDLNIEVRFPGDRGLGGEGLPASAARKLSDKTAVWGGDSLDIELELLRNG